jgi:hypothetical protein
LAINLESIESGLPDNKQKIAIPENEHRAEKVKAIGENLDFLKKTGIYYPFNHGTILSLYGWRGTPEGANLINEKQGILREIIAAIDQEKEIKSWIPSESNDEIVSVLEELTGKSSETEKEPVRH